MSDRRTTFWLIAAGCAVVAVAATLGGWVWLIRAEQERQAKLMRLHAHVARFESQTEQGRKYVAELADRIERTAAAIDRETATVLHQLDTALPERLAEHEKQIAAAQRRVEAATDPTERARLTRAVDELTDRWERTLALFEERRRRVIDDIELMRRMRAADQALHDRALADIELTESMTAHLRSQIAELEARSSGR